MIGIGVQPAQLFMFNVIKIRRISAFLGLVVFAFCLSSPVEAMWQPAKKGQSRNARKKEKQPEGAPEPTAAVSKPKPKKVGQGAFKFLEGRFNREDLPLYVKDWEDYKEFRVNWITSHLTYQYPLSRELMNLSVAAIADREKSLTEAFLMEAGEKLGSTSKVRNGATYLLQFVLFLPGVGVRVVELPSSFIYLSGSRYFEDLAYKRAKRIKVASHDFLTEAEFSEYKEDRARFKETAETKLVQGIGKRMEQRIREEIVGGAWAANALDSEALMLLDIKQNMPAILKALIKRVKEYYIEEYADKNPNYRPDIKRVSINSVVFGFSSYYKTCWRCRNLIQGFQYKTREILEDAARQTELPFEVSEEFGTLAFFYGRHATTCDKADKDPYAAAITRLENPLQVQMGYHQFAEF